MAGLEGKFEKMRMDVEDLKTQITGFEQVKTDVDELKNQIREFEQTRRDIATLKTQITELEEIKTKIEDLKSQDTKLENADNKINQRIDINDTKLRERDTISEALLQGERITGTTDGTANTESTHTHGLGKKPTIVFITTKSNGTVYLTSKSNANIKVKGSDSSLDFVAYLLI